MANRRRGPKVVWLPVDLNNRLGAASPATAFVDSSHFTFTLTGPGAGIAPSTAAIPLVKDSESTSAQLNIDATIADIASSGYRLRRVVGKLVVLVAQGVAAGAEDPTIYQVTMGVIVLKTDVTGVNTAQPADVYSPEILNSVSDPWVWRRSWVLGDQEGAATVGSLLRAPRSNIENYAGGNSDASHIDQKTARTVGSEERLFLVATCRGLDGQPQAVNPGAISIVGDLRMLGSIRTNLGNRGNASR